MSRRGPLRVLVVATGEPWPLNSGNRLHLYHVLRELCDRADVTLAIPATPRYRDHLPPSLRIETLDAAGLSAKREKGAGNGEHRRPAGKTGNREQGTGNRPHFHVPTFPRSHVALTSDDASLVGRLARRHFGPRLVVAAWLRDHARPERFDVVLLNGAVYGQLASEFRLPVVWNPQDELVLHTLRDVELRRWRRWPDTLYRLALYAACQRHVARHAAATIYVSSVDAGYARRWAGGARIEVVRNGVDLEYFSPNGTPPTPGTVAFVGSLEFPPNIDAIAWFTRHVWPLLHQAGTARRLLVVGRRPVETVRRLAEQPGVELAADVPDVRPYLTRAAVVVVPTRKGGGLKNKILEACAMRRPVVASPRAVGGLSARVGRDLLVACGPGDWARQLTRLLEQPERARWVADNGCDWVRRAHRWSDTGARFHEILAAAAGQAVGGRDARPAGRASRPPEVSQVTSCR